MSANNELVQLHSIMDVLKSIDVGLVILDQHYDVHLWNGFMESHSGLSPEEATGRSLFTLFPEIPEDWFISKAEPVFQLRSQAFTIWEQRPYLVKFKNNRPITGRSEFMFQNTSIIPIESPSPDLSFVCLVIYDVSDIAVGKQDLMLVNDELAELGRTDALTQLFNRGHWEKVLEAEYERAKRYDTEATLIMLDIDHFKKVNDTYGHQAGDDVIRTLSNIIRQTARKTDVCGRYGGEEFGIILPETPPDQAEIFAERLRKKVEAAVIPADNHELGITISSGLASFDTSFEDHTQWLEASDKALYQSKENGRNKYTLYKL